MTERGALDLTPWIAQYHTYMKSHGYAPLTISRRLKYLECFQYFVQSRGLASLEEFRPPQTIDFIHYWLGHHAWAKTSAGFSRQSRFEPSHHIALQYSLRSFFRWAGSTGYLKRDTFPWRAPVRGHYFFRQTSEYLDFCKDHKGLAPNTLNQIELFLRRFDHFLHAQHVSDFKQIQSQHIDLFVRQQASHNIRRIQRVHGVLRGFFRYLFSVDQLDRDWACAIRSPRQYRLAHTPHALKAEQVLRLLQSIDRDQPGAKRDFAVILMVSSLGLRCCEVALLRLQDVAWKQQVLRLEQIKNRSFLRLPLSRPLIEALVDYLKNERPKNSPYRNVFLRLTAPRRPLSAGSVSELIRRKMRQAAIPGSGHQLRHAFAAELLHSGIRFSTLQELLGHRHFTSTQIYTKIDLAQLQEVAENDGQKY